MNANIKSVYDLSHDFRMVIDGKLTVGAFALDVINPANGKVLTTCGRADRAQLEAAVAAAKAAFRSWSTTSIAERRRVLFEIADEFESKAEEFARLLTQEQGKPLAQAFGEIGGSIGMLRAFSEMELPDRVLRDTAEEWIVQQHVPLGVIAAITPWNFPVMLLITKLAPALLAGNTVVAKPAPTTPLTTLLFGELCAKFLPPGVFNVIVDDNDLGEYLTSHEHIAKVAFTGSTATGRKVMASAASTVKRLTLELGGNDAAIVLDDADVEKTAASIFQGAMINAGQACIAVKRVYVPDSMYEAICAEFIRLADAVVLGDGLDEGTEMGPLQNKAQFERVKDFLNDALEHGKVIAGGRHLDREGYFLSPAIVRDIAERSALVQQEQFGPVLPVLRYSNVDDAIQRVNAGSYGLAASVWGEDLARARKVAEQIDSGTVWINKVLDLSPDVPFCGAKQSGFGAEMGQDGLEEFTQSRIINMAR